LQREYAVESELEGRGTAVQREYMKFSMAIHLMRLCGPSLDVGALGESIAAAKVEGGCNPLGVSMPPISHPPNSIRIT
jgi:hypothetical protein